MNFRKADAAVAQLENREVKVEKKEEDDEEKECEEAEEEITEEVQIQYFRKHKILCVA